MSLASLLLFAIACSGSDDNLPDDTTTGATGDTAGVAAFVLPGPPPVGDSGLSDTAATDTGVVSLTAPPAAPAAPAVGAPKAADAATRTAE